METTTAVPAAKISAQDDLLTVSAISLLAWMVASMSHEGIGHALTALLTGTPSGVLSTMAWSSPYETTRLVAAGGTLANLAEALVFWLALRGARKASAQTRLFLFAGCTFNLFTGSGYFFFSGVSNFGDWACGTRFPRELSLAKICPARAFLACPPQAPRSYLMFFNRLSMPATACSVLN